LTKNEKLLRKELMLTQKLFKLAQERIKQLGIPSFSEYVRTLIYRDVDEHAKGEPEE
jgi:hypothetical protein